MLAAQLHYRHTSFRFLQKTNNLFFAESLLHGPLLFKNRTLLRHEANGRGSSTPLFLQPVETRGAKRQSGTPHGEKIGATAGSKFANSSSLPRMDGTRSPISSKYKNLVILEDQPLK